MTIKIGLGHIIAIFLVWVGFNILLNESKQGDLESMEEEERHVNDRV